MKSHKILALIFTGISFHIGYTMELGNKFEQKFTDTQRWIMPVIAERCAPSGLSLEQDEHKSMLLFAQLPNSYNDMPGSNIIAKLNNYNYALNGCIAAHLRYLKNPAFAAQQTNEKLSYIQNKLKTFFDTKQATESTLNDMGLQTRKK